MTVSEAHILFDSLLREVNKEIQENIIPEQKDIFLNAAAHIKIKESARKERDQIRNIMAYANLNDYYSNLAPFIIELDLPVVAANPRYVHSDLPTPSKTLTLNNLFLNNTWYVITAESAGFDVTNLTDSIENDSFIYIGQAFEVVIPNVVWNGNTGNGGGNPIDKTVATTSKIIKGNIYKIIKSNADLSTYGAVSNLPGSIFKANQDFDFKLLSNANIQLEVYAAKPKSLGAPQFKASPINSKDYAEILLISAMVDVSKPISSGGLTKGKQYRVSRVGNTDLRAFGLQEQTVNSVFQSTITGAPDWTTVPTALVEIDVRGTELLKPVDIEMKLNHAFGTVISRPLSIIADNQIRIYHLGNFNIFRCSVLYVRVPNRINYLVGGELEFNELEHTDLVQRAVNLAAASITSDNYQPLKIESSGSNVKQQTQ